MTDDREAALSLTAALVILASFNIPTDIQGLLIGGDPNRHIRPGALQAVLEAARKARE
jgi:hypothetical protein